jgi:hypothetical protein
MTFNLLLLFTVLKIQASLTQVITQSPIGTAPSIAPAIGIPTAIDAAPSFAPAIGTDCINTPDWSLYVFVLHLELFDDFLFCDDEEVTCYDVGTTSTSSEASASDHCCKCKPECSGVCFTIEPTPYPTNYLGDSLFVDDDDEDEFSSSVLFVVVALLGFLFTVTCIKANQRNVQRQLALHTTRRTMSRRRQTAGQTAASTPEPEDDNARYEKILTKFHFQTVLPDKSNTNLESIRSTEAAAAAQEDEEDGATPPKEESGPPTATSLSQRLASWRKPSAKDECCICLDGYHPGETICAAATPECNHVFHQECVVEWMTSHDECPLCRVNLMS